jgi:hypothetical protein
LPEDSETFEFLSQECERNPEEVDDREDRVETDIEVEPEAEAVTPPPSSLPIFETSHPSADAARVATDTVVDDEKPPHLCSTEELRAIVHQKGVPHVERMSRDQLTNAIHKVKSWEAKSSDDLRKVAKDFNWKIRPAGTHKELIKDMIDAAWGEESARPVPSPPEEKPKVAPEAPGYPRSATTTAPTAGRPLPTPASQPVPLTGSGRSSSSTARPSTARPSSELPPEEALALEVRRINACTSAKDYRNILGFAIGESLTLTLAKSRYRGLMLLLHPDKRTAAGEALAGGHEACENAYDRVCEAYQQ